MKFILFAVSVLLTASMTLYGQNSILSRTISSNRINAIAEDPDGSLWIGTDNGLNKFNGDTYLIYYSGTKPESLKNDYITSLEIGKNGELLIGTQMGITIFDGKSFKSVNDFDSPINPVRAFKALDKHTYIYFDYSSINSVDAEDLSSKGKYWGENYNSSSTLEITDQNEIWIDVNKWPNREIQILDKDLHLVDSLATNIESKITGAFLTEDGRYWAYSNKDLLCYNTSTHKSIGLPSLENIAALGEILFACPYKENRIILGIHNFGLIDYNYVSGIYRHIILVESLPYQNYNAFIDSEYNVLIYNKADSFKIFSENDNVKKYSGFIDHLKDNFVYDIGFDESGDLIFLTSKDVATLSLNDFSIQRQQKRYSFIDGIVSKDGSIWVIGTTGYVVQSTGDKNGVRETKYFKLPHFVFSVCEDNEGNKWFLSNSALFKIDKEKKIVQYSLPESFSGHDPIRLISSKSSGDILLKSPGGTYIVENNGELDKLSIENNMVVNSIEKDNEGIYWLATNHGLVRYDHQSKESKVFTIENGLPGNSIQRVIFDDNQDLWIITTNCISRKPHSTNRIITYSNKDFANNRFNINVPVIFDRNGSLLIGDKEGIIKMDKKEEQKNTARSLKLSSITINGETVADPKKSLTLKYNHKEISFCFPYPDINPQTQIKYRYKFDSRDKDWTYINSFPYVSYQNLAPGKYTFVAEIINPDGSWSNDGIRQSFKVRRMPFASIFAYIIYVLMSFSLIYSIFKTKINRERYIHADKINKANENMIDTLTNISHELRTPLTLIYAPMKEMLLSSEIDDKNKELLGVVENNVNRLKELTDHLIDFGKNKIEEDRLSVSNLNVGLLLKQIVENFRFLTIDKDIELTSEIEGDIEGWLDLKIVETIINNLLSNAIKYTPSGGQIHVALERLSSEGRLRVSVKDNGIGIEESRRKDLFIRYNRLGNENSAIVGSGIGLNYASYLAGLHKGNLEYRPVEPKGSEFIFTVPYVKSAFSEDEISQSSSPSFGFQNVKSVTAETNKSKTVIIVDDDTEIVSYLTNLFKNEWNIQIAHNGEEAYSLTTEIVPDIIISDVVMPIKDGYELCRNIRENPDLSHIPIILLTAKDDAKSHCLGLETGADAYIAKPFNPYILKAEADTIVKNRQKIQSKILNMTSKDIASTELPSEEEEASSMSRRDMEFMSKVQSIIDKNIEEESFNVAALADELSMSYNNLYLKIKSLTGQTPQTYLNTYKMNIAKMLLEEGSMTVSEVSYKIGASSISSFSRSFKKHFGIPPSEVRGS